MRSLSGGKDDECPPEKYIIPASDKDVPVQLVLSLVLGVSAFLLFCILRPRWPALYAARKRRLDPRIGLPHLSKSFLGWTVQLYKITEEQVLASAGLDAFAFLAFFKMSIRLFALLTFLAAVIIAPINVHFRGTGPPFVNKSLFASWLSDSIEDSSYEPTQPTFDDTLQTLKETGLKDKSFLWSYSLFTYLFVGLTIYLINWETCRIIRYRQDYLGTQSTVTDRTFRMTGIPTDLRSEDRIKHLIEKLDIGTVESVTLCRHWQELDDIVEKRHVLLRKLEVAWAKLLKQQNKSSKADSSFTSSNSRPRNESLEAQSQRAEEEAGENGRLLGGEYSRPHVAEGERPQVTIRYGFLGLQSRKMDAIDYYEEKLRRIDAKVTEARKKTYPPTDMALVTMDTVAACQMFIQARIDPRPGRLLTKPTPSPSDLVWRNTYSPRGIRRLKSWSVTIFITVLTLVWIFPTAFLASFVSICTVKKFLPSFATWLSTHPIIQSLFQTGLPTLVVSLLNVAVPYLYDFLSNHQGMISQGDVELSVISKNFFFTFFNTFFVFAVTSTGFDFWSTLRKFLKDTSQIPEAIASDVERLSRFYTSFIILQGIGLMPFRILEVGSVFLAPFMRMMSKTPRDFAELKKPPVFQYGFYLPTSLLVFNLCIIYSVLRNGYIILFFGTVYFTLGYFTFKYMVLYAMDQPQHATGGAWRMICYRLVIGLLVFEVVMFGQIASLKAYFQSVVLLPLIPFTIWYSYYFKRRFEPLTRYIALRAVRSSEDPEDAEAVEEGFLDEGAPRPSQNLLRRGSTLDEDKEKGLRFLNPSLIAPLQQAWIYKDPPPSLTENGTEVEDDREPPHLILPNADSTLGIGESNVWIDRNV
ncbi:hypothetical protein B0I35DRAFT_452380 [Stachybotrys elegans]|uniref:CSC1/OSCA1-like 7TM region domain-containing protein n=1 Tax=Stachybotrys elegans TaxID=80388 RepID=A0A8K0SN97_9HYPO|nr:hypothetical protein B0I35DRAFT_452380 [Stachybotrys elegans]